MSGEEAAGDFASRAKDGLQSKVLGAPLYIWGGVFVVGFWAYKKWTDAKKAKTAATLPDPNLNHPGGLPSTQTGPASSGALNNIVPTSGSVSGINTSNIVSSPLDAGQWVSLGTAFLAAAGYDGSKANQYLSQYATGITPTAEGARYVNLVLNKYGPPQTVAAGQTSLPVNGAKITGFVQPAGKVGVFAQYDDGSLVWLKDGISTGNILASAKAAGIDTNIQQLPVSDPIWQNADVVRNGDPYYLWSEKWAEYVDPTHYISNRPDIVTSPAAIQAANAAWARSQSILPAKWQGDNPALADQAVSVAFPTGTP